MLNRRSPWHLYVVERQESKTAPRSRLIAASQHLHQHRTGICGKSSNAVGA
jgi:hypothetical protein